MTLFWLSFVDPDLPSDDKLLGVSIVEIEGDSIVEAVREARRKGCNPGGEVVGREISAREAPPFFRNRLLDREEAMTLVKGVQ